MQPRPISPLGGDAAALRENARQGRRCSPSRSLSRQRDQARFPASSSADNRPGRPASCRCGRPCSSTVSSDVPVQAPEQQRILLLHMGEERVAAHGMRRRHRQPDQRRSQRADLAVILGHRQPRAPPQAGSTAAWMRTVPTTRSAATPSMDMRHDGLRDRRRCRRGHRRRTSPARGRTPRRRSAYGAIALPCLGGELDLELRWRMKGRERLDTSCDQHSVS